jgi:hypothetical protein
MELNVTSIAFLTAGAVLLYAAIKNTYPQDVIRKAMGKDPIHGPIVGEWSVGKKLDKPSAVTLPPATGVPVVTV